jgi:pyruvate,orthophosphate dikinase
MPGMMQTVLNLGLTQTTLRGFLRLMGNPRLAADCRRRLVQQFAEVVHGTGAKAFEDMLTAKLHEERLMRVEELDSRALSEPAAAYEEKFRALVGEEFPSSPMEQVRASVEAVLKSWMSAPAESYRKLNDISDELGTATLVQAMVFGNGGPMSGAGVGFTRNPSDGSNKLYVDYLPNAQGEDVVAGRRNAFGLDELERRAPEACQELRRACSVLEPEFGDMQDFEFTVEQGRLYMLQSRAGKRTPIAALRIAHDLVSEKIIAPKAGAKLLEGIDLDAIEVVEIASTDNEPIAEGVPASAGVAVGGAVFDASRVEEFRRQGKPVVLMRENAETSDIEALSQAEALLTMRGARTSHAAVVARQLGKVCVVGCDLLKIDDGQRSGVFGPIAIKEGETVTVDGTSGLIFGGDLQVRRTRPQKLLAEARRWQVTASREKALKRSPIGTK